MPKSRKPQRTRESGEPRESRISAEMLDEMLAGQDPREAFQQGDLLADLRTALAERVLDAEIAVHLEGESARGERNHRNGHNRKRVLTEGGAMEVAVPRDRLGRFEPRLIEKYCRRLPGFDEKVLSMYGRGMSTRDIRRHVEDFYGVEVSRELISKVTDAVHEEVREWRSRPLDPVCALMYLDGIRVKIREEGLVRNRVVHLAIGVSPQGRKEVLGMWIAEAEGSRFWLSVLNDLKRRGLEDVLVVVVDGLSGFPAAIEAVYPEAVVQTCVVHLIRNSMAYASQKERGPLAAALKTIYRAADAEAAAEALEAFEGSDLGRKYPAVGRAWRRQWDQVIPFFAFSEPIRRVMYTTNAIESLNSTVRRAVKAHGHFPHDRSAMKLIYLALREVERKWKRPTPIWHLARSEFSIRFGDRFRLDTG